MSMSLISNCTFVLYFDEDLIQRIFMKPQDKLLLMYRHVTMMHQQYTCMHKILFSKVARLRLLGLLSDIAYWKDMCQIKDTHAIE